MRTSLVVALLAVLFTMTGIAEACPNCARGIAEDVDGSGNVPLAFYYSILFMMSMPFLLTAAFGIAFYRMSRQSASTETDPSPEVATDPVDPVDPVDSAETENPFRSAESDEPF